MEPDVWQAIEKGQRVVDSMAEVERNRPVVTNPQYFDVEMFPGSNCWIFAALQSRD